MEQGFRSPNPGLATSISQILYLLLPSRDVKTKNISGAYKNQSMCLSTSKNNCKYSTVKKMDHYYKMYWLNMNALDDNKVQNCFILVSVNVTGILILV